jgi:hypothetical protein
MDLANNINVGYGSNWMQLSLDDDSDDEGTPDPCKELNEYLDSKHEELREGLVEWWGVSLAYITSLGCPANSLLPRVSIIPLVTLPSPASHEIILQSKDHLLPQSMLSRVVGSLEPTYAIDSSQTHSRRFRSSRALFAMAFSMPVMKRRLIWQWSGILVVLLTKKIAQTLSSRFLSVVVCSFTITRVCHLCATATTVQYC